MNSPVPFAAALSPILFAGCRPTDTGNSQVAGPTPPIATTNTQEFEVRLVAALEIASPSFRDEALGKLAADAAAAGESAVTVKAIQNIASPSDHDRYAATAGGGWPRPIRSKAAWRWRASFSSPSTRDETLKLIATGSQTFPQTGR
jgi:hypothetical protein